jgi:hypothetical protein
MLSKSGGKVCRFIASRLLIAGRKSGRLRSRDFGRNSLIVESVGV